MAAKIASDKTRFSQRERPVYLGGALVKEKPQKLRFFEVLPIKRDRRKKKVSKSHPIKVQAGTVVGPLAPSSRCHAVVSRRHGLEPSSRTRRDSYYWTGVASIALLLLFCVVGAFKDDLPDWVTGFTLAFAVVVFLAILVRAESS